MTAGPAPTCCRSSKSWRKPSCATARSVRRRRCARARSITRSPRSAAARASAPDIAVAAFGCASASAAEAMAALALIDIDRRRYLDAEPLLIVAERVLSARVTADHPAMATIFAGPARIDLAHGDKIPAENLASRALAIARRHPDGRSAA